MTNHSVIHASGTTHAKIAFLAIAVSAVFMALVAASGVTKSDGVRVSGPAVKASATMLASSDRTLVR
jgi:hypothetical protein